MRRLLLALGLLALSASAHAQSAGKAPWEEYGKRIKASEAITPLGPNLFGDQVSLSNGALSFSVTDVSLPGNSDLPVALTRSYQVRDWRYRIADGMMLDWDLDVPSISAIHAGPWVDNSGGQSRCSVPGPPPSPTQYPGLHAIDFWQGAQLNLPGVSSGEMLTRRAEAPQPSTGGPWIWMTNDQVHFSCLPTIQNGTGEGFLAITPDGTRIWFNRMAQHHEPWMRRGHQTVIQGGAPLSYEATIRRNVLLATRVEDRFGNWVTYTYTNGPTERARLTQITANDGRTLTLTYNAQGAVSNVSDGTRSWTYAYGTTGAGRGTLTQVTLPDASQWSIQFGALTDAEILQTEVFQSGEIYRTCTMNELPLNLGTEPVGTVTHPSGATGAFRVSLVEHGRSKVPVTCSNVTTLSGMPPGGGNDKNDDTPFFPIKYYAYSLKTKTITGPGLPQADWTYAYNSGASFVYQAGATFQYPVCDTSRWLECITPPCQSDACAGRSTTVVTGPGGSWIRYKHGNTFQYDEGKLISVEEGTGDTNILRTTTYAYDLNFTDGAYLKRWGIGQRGNGDSFPNEYHRPQVRVTTTQQGQVFTWRADSFDAFARPLQATRFSNLPIAANSRTDMTTFHDRTDLWVLGQLARVDNINVNRVIEKTEFDPATALPVRFYSPGTTDATSPPQLLQTLTFNPDGTIATATDGRNKLTTLANWYRGVPRLITFADGRTQSATVDALGQIRSVTDENGYTTSYGYDPAGRMTLVDYPDGDSPDWASKTIAYAQVAAAEYGIPAGHWRQTVAYGNYRKYVYFDAMWRPVMEREHDASNVAGTDRFKRYAYHDTGTLAFASYPGTSSSLPTGTWHQYDVLGRPVRTEQDSEFGRLVTQFAYLAGLRTRVTNPRGYVTETAFQAFDQPGTDTPVEIIAALGTPEQQTTLISKNALGQSLAVTRNGTWNSAALSLTRSYVYDEQLRLCQRVEPETNTTVYAYDTAGNVAWYAEGQPASTTCADGRAAVAASAKVVNTYDDRNRITLVNYPGTAVDIATTYHPDGQVHTITAGASTLTYEYNRRRLLVSERSQLDTFDWLTTHAYTALGHLAATTYVDGEVVPYAPNALGQATQAGTYATGATYYPNGALKQFTYGNGLVHTLTLNARQLPERSRDALGTNVVLDDTYDFDFNGNVAGITDSLGGQPGNRDMSYDALDRLVGVTAGSAQGGNGVFAYDPLDNLRRLDQGSRTGRYEYSPTTGRLSALKDAAGATLATYTHDARGNLTSRTQGGATHTFTFDEANRLRSTTLAGSSYAYDGLGRRVSDTSGGVTAMSLYSREGKLLYRDDPQAGRKYYYVYLAGSLVAERSEPRPTGVDTIVYQHTDALGSPVAETDASGTVVKRERMTAYGEPADGGWENGPGYTGHQMDAATKLVYMQQRYYDPVVGRFLSVDPVTANSVNGSNFNRYWYANNNPYTFTDPDGRQARNGRGNPNPNFGSLSADQKREVAKIVAKSHQMDISGENIEIAPGRGAQITANSLILHEQTFESRSELAAAIGHEIEMHLEVHINERGGDWGASVDAQQHHLDEAEAFQYNVDNAQRFNNSPSEVKHFENARDGHKEAAEQVKKRDEQ